MYLLLILRVLRLDSSHVLMVSFGNVSVIFPFYFIASGLKEGARR